MKKIIFLIASFFLLQFTNAQTGLKTKNVILITLDGLRWQEVFGGADSLILYNKEYVKNIKNIEGKYWNSDPVIRREMLMPFLWGTIENKGQLYGNRNVDSKVNVTNPYWFSYPGYNEILCGFADEKINTNGFGPNPNTNVLEYINKQKRFEGKTAAFTSWDAFPDILNEKRSGILVNAAFENLEGDYGDKVAELNHIQYLLPDVFYGIRLDAVTFNLGFEYLKSQKPRFLFIGLDETDDFAHGGNYDYYLNSAHYSDKMIQELWQWLQSDPHYKDQTTILITCDHGRGIAPDKWKDHGTKAAGSDQTWFAIIGPDTPAMGEVHSGQFYNNQYAKTLAALLGLNYTSNNETGEVIKPVFK